MRRWTRSTILAQILAIIPLASPNLPVVVRQGMILLGSMGLLFLCFFSSVGIVIQAVIVFVFCFLSKRKIEFGLVHQGISGSHFFLLMFTNFLFQLFFILSVCQFVGVGCIKTYDFGNLTSDIGSVTVTPILEELVYRRIIPGILMSFFSQKSSIVFATILFSAVHDDKIGALTFALSAFYLYLNSGKIILPILFHFFHNLGVLIVIGFFNLHMFVINHVKDWVTVSFAVVFLFLWFLCIRSWKLLPHNYASTLKTDLSRSRSRK